MPKACRLASELLAIAAALTLPCLRGLFPSSFFGHLCAASRAYSPLVVRLMIFGEPVQDEHDVNTSYLSISPKIAVIAHPVLKEFPWKDLLRSLFAFLQLPRSLAIFHGRRHDVSLSHFS